jgi:hypothetical protein
MLASTFDRSANDFEEIDTAGVEIHPTAAGERIARVVLDDSGLGFADSDKSAEILG